MNLVIEDYRKKKPKFYFPLSQTLKKCLKNLWILLYKMYRVTGIFVLFFVLRILSITVHARYGYWYCNTQCLKYFVCDALYMASITRFFCSFGQKKCKSWYVIGQYSLVPRRFCTRVYVLLQNLSENFVFTNFHSEDNK